MPSIRSLGIKNRLILLSSAYVLLLTVVLITGGYALNQFSNSMAHLNSHRLQALKSLKIIADAYSIDIARNTLQLRNGNVSADAATKNIAKAQDLIKTEWGNYSRNKENFSTDEVKLADAAQKEMAAMQGKINALNDVLTGKVATAPTELELMTMFNSIIDDSSKVVDAMSRLTDRNLKEAQAEYEHDQQVYQGIRAVIIAVVIIGILAAAFVTVRIVASVVVPVSRLLSLMKDIEQSGDLTLRAHSKHNDEVGQIGKNFDELMQRFSLIIRDTTQSAGMVESTAMHLNTTSEALNNRANAQQDAASNVSAALEELTTSVHESASFATSIQGASVDAAEKARHGTEIVNKAARNMQDVFETFDQTQSLVGNLESQSKEVSKIASMINDISQQTNLLALNAAIEAARAGEAGRGFAVVADEVRKLADRTQNATLEITRTITGIQNGIGQVRTSANAGAELVNDGVKYTNDASRALEQLNQSAQETQHKVAAISDALKEQKSASEEIAEHMLRITSMATETAEETSEAMAQSREMSALAEQMNTAVSRFKV